MHRCCRLYKCVVPRVRMQNSRPSLTDVTKTSSPTHTHTHQVAWQYVLPLSTCVPSLVLLSWKWKSILGEMWGRHAGTRIKMYHWPPPPPCFLSYSGGSEVKDGGGCSHLLTMPLWCLPTSVPDGDLVGMLKFNADESWLTSWEINVTHRPECWWRAGWRYLIFSFGGGGFMCREQ